ncbi:MULTISPECIES: type II toxin-antitoxin system HicB family antitoxin [unclassified Exiguobacterium]|uniref:type II toxin-antitoxin system HicB family antitoxin n=1 Tax=unclassified Exiguobacterium TaxID=2644629 RepID=UPI000B58C481|nr:MULTISPECIES: type II toxin-antitoxin system HicB family antitoxin [unclassified Exiguobacterium]ASI35077.1 HicB family protein [Exiguobacterium sp. N4-1P]
MLVTPDLENDCYLVRFPDLKNVFTDGETLLETVKHAEEVLEGMLEVMIDYNTKFNTPSPVSDLKIEEGESLIAVEVHVTPKGTDGDFKQELIDGIYADED